MRLIFMGTPDFAVQTLQKLASEHDIIAVYTREPKPAGRGMDLRKSPVHLAAEALNIPVFTPKSLKNTPFPDYQADAAVVVAYGLLLPQYVLDAPKFGCYNLHASLLPRWRGAAPLQRAIMAGDTETGAMVMKMDIGLDTGDIAMTYRHTIGDNETTAELHDVLSHNGADLMVEAMRALENGVLSLTPQSVNGVTYAQKIDKTESQIDFQQSPSLIHNHIRGLSPFPGAWFDHHGTRLKVLKSEIATSDDGFVINGVRLLTVQKAGSKPMTGDDYLRGLR